MNWSDIQEEELKNQVAAHYFGTYDCTKIVGRIDFAVTPKLKPGQKQAADNKIEYLLWAEAKRGTVDLDRAITQLILTIGKEINRGHAANLLPPPWLGAFDCSSIIFLPYDAVQDFFSTNDFNWNVAPSNHGTREFDMVLRRVKTIMEGDDAIRFDYASRHDELKAWIRDNLRPDPGSDERIIINRNNFVPIFQLWDKEVRPTIDINWDVAKKEGYISADFFLADLLSDQNHTQMLDLFVLLKGNKYQYNKRRKASGSLQFEQADFNDGQRAHKEFWRHYRRPPRRELWHELVERRDLLVPQDVRERKGSFFTPQIWVRKSQEYLADVLGPDWQDEYTIWDCCAGTGNLLNGLKNKWNIWASTLDQADVQVMRERIENGANLLPEHVFQFDFLNDNFSKLPPPLKKIIDNEEDRKKLVIYINPPYAEAGDAKQKTGTGRNKPKTATDNSAWERFKPLIGNASNELFAQFFFRVYQDIGGCVLAEFSKLKILQAPNFKDFRKAFQPKLEKMFIVPANTFDNVKGEFPIGFFVWDTKKRGLHTDCVANVYDEEGLLLQQKVVYINDNKKTLANWLSEVKKTKPSGMKLGMMDSGRNDFQHQNLINIQLNIGAESHALVLTLTPTNIVEGLVYFSVRHCIEANWLNDRDQFLYPDEGWKSDNAFQSDCLAFALLHGQNRISAAAGPNHWIPFTEDQVQPREKFASHFMSDFLRGKLPAPQAAEGGKNPGEPELPLPHAPLSAAPPAEPYNGTQPVAFTPAAQAVMEAGLALWRHYHQAAAGQPGYDANASYYDIRRHFQGTSTTPAGKERMNNTSPDDRYNQLLANLRHAQRRLAAQIADKVYEYGFLR